MENIQKFKKAQESNENLEKIALELLGEQPSNLEIKWNNRLRTSAGRCRYYIDQDRYEINISRKLYSNFWNFKEESKEFKELAESFIDTVIHELAHYCQRKKYKKGGHGETFVKEAKRLGGSGRKYYTDRESYLFGRIDKESYIIEYQLSEYFANRMW